MSEEYRKWSKDAGAWNHQDSELVEYCPDWQLHKRCRSAIKDTAKVGLDKHNGTAVVTSVIDKQPALVPIARTKRFL